ncbi:hypothetical protein [Aureispira anguillae]|uniref:Uncharacterized protein n=1 Tax=Aureispira anguillae TaxID=2864201 RepID=A0A916DTS1_9BACT|nr:hypothetical protein [Aureispira anguillae]BDS11696.1 hypothetical protein AsAng_0024100 [Aureispira anguillae]
MTFLEAIQADWIFYAVNILVFIVVVMVTWLYARGQQMEAIAKLQAQIQQIQLQQNDKLFSLEDEYKLKKERVRLILKDMEAQLKANDMEMLKSRRNELSNVFVMEYRETMHRYARLADQYYELHPPKYQEFVRNYIFPFLDTSRKILSAINATIIMKALGESQPIQYSYKDFDFAFDMIRKHPTLSLKKEMNAYLKELGFSKSDLD